MKSMTRKMTAITTTMQATPAGGGLGVCGFPRAGLNLAGRYFAIPADGSIRGTIENDDETPVDGSGGARAGRVWAQGRTAA